MITETSQSRASVLSLDLFVLSIYLSIRLCLVRIITTQLYAKTKKRDPMRYECTRKPECWFVFCSKLFTWSESKAGTFTAQRRRCSTALASRAKWCSSSASQSPRTAHPPCSCSWPRSLWRDSPTLVQGHGRQNPRPPALTPGLPYSPPRSEAPSQSASHERSGPALVWCPAEHGDKGVFMGNKRIR